jgi:hypothetical protein
MGKIVEMTPCVMNILEKEATHVANKPRFFNPFKVSLKGVCIGLLVNGPLTCFKPLNAKATRKAAAIDAPIT